MATIDVNSIDVSRTYVVKLDKAVHMGLTVMRPHMTLQMTGASLRDLLTKDSNAVAEATPQ